MLPKYNKGPVLPKYDVRRGFGVKSTPRAEPWLQLSCATNKSPHISGIDIALHDLKARKLGIQIYELLGGKLRDKLAVYAWIGRDRPNDVATAARFRKSQGFRAIKMNATEDLGWLDSPSAHDSAVESQWRSSWQKFLNHIDLFSLKSRCYLSTLKG